jgi:hypothetical protein
MSTATLERPAPDVGLSTDVDHLVCCDEDVALCGVDVAGQRVCPEDCGHPTCPMCALMSAEDIPCRDPGCSYRDGGS